MTEAGKFDPETFRRSIEKDMMIASGLLQSAQDLNTQGEVDAAEALWERAVELDPGILFKHQGYRAPGSILRLIYAVGLGELVPLTDQEETKLREPLKINPHVSLADLHRFLEQQYLEHQEEE